MTILYLKGLERTNTSPWLAGTQGDPGMSQFARSFNRTGTKIEGTKKPNFEQNVLQSSEPTKSKPNKPKTMITSKNETIAFNWTI